MACKHAENIMLYALDAEKYDEPWKHWWHRSPGGNEWRAFDDHPRWYPSFEYRRKPQTRNIAIGETTINQTTVKPTHGIVYYVPTFTISPLYTGRIWTDCSEDDRLWEIGLVHNTSEAARAHAQALLSCTRI